MLHSFIFMEFLGLTYIIYRYKVAKKHNLNFWGNPNFYLFFLSIFYLIHPCYLYYEEIIRLFIFDDRIMEKVYQWSVYYYLVFFLFYILSNDKKFFEYKIKEMKFSAVLLNHIKIILFISCFVLSLIVLFATRKIDSSLSKVDKYLIYVETLKFSGFMFLSWFIVTWSFIMAIMKKNFYYLFLLIPLIYLELVCNSRFYIFVFIIAAFLYRIFVLKRNIKIIHFIISAIIIFLIGILREVSFSDADIISVYFSAFGEFINTWSSIGLILSENFKFDTSPLFVFIQRLIPEPFSGFVFGPKLNYANYISDLHNLGIGLGSSIVTEGIVYSDFITYSLPFVIGLIYLLLNNCIKKNTINAKLINFFLIINTFAVLRGTAIINISSYIMIFFFIFKIPYFILKDFRLLKIES